MSGSLCVSISVYSLTHSLLKSPSDVTTQMISVKNIIIKAFYLWKMERLTYKALRVITYIFPHRPLVILVLIIIIIKTEICL